MFQSKRVLSKMDKFVKEALITHKTYNPVDFYFFIKDACKYHVIVHKTAFESFLKKINKNTVPLKARIHGNHVHFLVWSKYPLEVNSSIISKSIENNRRNSYFIRPIFTFSRELLHHFCKITFEIPSLEEMAIIKILSNLSNLHDLKQLNLSVPYMRKLFQQAESHFHLPEWDGKFISETIDIIELDRTYDREFVVRYQNSKKVFDSSLYLIANYFLIDNCDKPVRMCRECMKFVRGKGDYIRRYRCRKKSFTFCDKFVRSVFNWCQACKRVPLFQILPYYEIRKQYRFHPFRHSPFNKILKTEYFRDGDLIQSKYSIRCFCKRRNIV